MSKADKAVLEKKLGAATKNSKKKVWVEPWLIAMAQCKQDSVTLDIKQLDESVTVQKSDFGIIVVLIDFIIVIIFIGFIYFLDKKQH